MPESRTHPSPETSASHPQQAGKDTPPVICLLGPTASGKTAAALALAEVLPVEIISLDSALVYRGMDIGTAKPTPEELARAPHHLIDIIDPTESYSAARFAADATALIDEIRARDRVPLIVGGTMLYYKALANGLNDLPGAAPEIRAALDAEAAERGWPALHAELAQVDAPTAARLAPNDSQRIQRALEIWRQTGRPMSDWLAAARARPGDSAHELLPIALEPSDRGALHARIAQRFELMLQAGLLDEVAQLRARGDLHLGLPSMRCVGYRQGWEYLDGSYGTGASGLEQLRERGIAATRQLAKRQLTWLRSTPQRRVIDCIARDATQQVLNAALAALGR